MGGECCEFFSRSNSNNPNKILEKLKGKIIIIKRVCEEKKKLSCGGEKALSSSLNKI